MSGAINHLASRQTVIHRCCDGSPLMCEVHETMETAPTEAATSHRSLTKSTTEPAKTREVSMASTKNSPVPTPDDPRHGKNTGYNAGCREACCRKAHMIWMKRYRMYGADELIDATGTHRRIQALVAIGHTLYDLSVELGMTTRYAGKILVAKKVRPSTADTVDELYERLSMTHRDGWIADRSRLMAATKGWAPPLAWDDIDNPNERPAGVRYVAPCGTDVSYMRHLRNGQEPCARCRDAHREARAIERSAA